MSIQKLSSNIKNLFYKKEDIAVEEESDLLNKNEAELNDFEFSSKELYLTLDKNPDMTDLEIFELFPEFENNQDVLKEAKKKASIFGGDSLKKKDKSTELGDSLDVSVASESETPSTSSDKKDVLKTDVKKEDTKKSIFDPDKYRKGIANVEASGKMDYSLTSFKDKEGNPVSSAVGPYQFLYNTHADLLKSNFGVNSKEEFIGNKEAQENLMSYMLEDKPGRYPFMARRIQKDYKNQIPKDLEFSDLIALQHFVGHGDLRKLFARVRDEKDFNPEDIYETQPKGKNLKIGDYLKRYRSGYNAVDDPTSMMNPLEDPGLMAAGDNLPIGDYTAPKEFEYKVEIKDGVQSFIYDGKEVDEEEFRSLYKKNSNKSEAETEKELSNIITKAKEGAFKYLSRKEQQKLGLRKLTEDEVEQGFQWALSDGEPKMVKKATGQVSGKQSIGGGDIQTSEVLGPDGQLITIPVGNVSEEDLQVAASGEGVDTKTSTEIKNEILNKVNITGEKISEEDLEILVDDFKLKYEESKVDLINDIKTEIDELKYDAFTPGLESKVREIIDSRGYVDLQRFISSKNENIFIDKGTLETDVLKLAPSILYDIYTGKVLEKPYEKFVREFDNYHKKKVDQRQVDYEARNYTSIRDVPFGMEIDKIRNNVGTKEVTKADRSRDIISFAFDILEEEIYDDIPESWIAIMAEEIANRYHMNSEEYTTKRDENRDNALIKYNETRETPLLLPSVAANNAIDEYNSLPNQDEETKKNIIRTKYGVTILEDGSVRWPESFDSKYIEELNTVIGPSDRETWKNYKKDNATEKNIVAEGFENTLFGQGITLMTDKPIHPEWGVQYTDLEQFTIGVLGIATDLALPIIGYGVNIGTKAAINSKRAWLIKQQSNALENYAKKNGLNTKVKLVGDKTIYADKKIRDYNNLLTIKTAEKLKKYEKKANIVGGSANLGTWMAASDGVAQYKETHSLADLDYFHILEKGVEGAGLGWITGKIGYRERDIKNKITSLGFTPVVSAPLKFTVTGGALVAEAGAFTGVTALVGEGGLTVDALRENSQFILALRAIKFPMKVVKGEAFTKKDQNKGIYEFKLTEAEKEYIGQQGKTNVEIYKEIEKIINSNEKTAVDFINILPTNILGKYVFASTGSKLVAPNPLDGIVAEAKIVPNKPNLVVLENKNGQPLATKKFNNEREAIEYIKKIEKNKIEEEASVILDNNILNTESKAKLELELEKLGLTMSDVNKNFAIENKTGDQRIIADRIGEKIIEIYNNQQKTSDKITQELQKGTETMTSEQRDAVLKSREIDLEEIKKDIQQKKDAGIEEVSTEMRKLNELLGKKPEEPIEVTEENITKLEEAAKTDLQKEAIKDIITATEALKNIKGKVIVHTDNSSYQKALDEAEKGNTAEVIGGHRVVSGKNKGDVHFNLNALNKRTAFHELGGHKLIEEIRESNPEKIERIENEIYNLIKNTPEFAPVLDFINQKSQGKQAYSESEKKMEATAEFIARSVKGEIKIEQNSKFVDGLKNNLNKLMKTLGLEYRFATNSEALTFVAGITNNLAKGKTIEVEKGDKKEVKVEAEGPAKIQKRVSEQVDYHNKNEGSTFDQKGKIVEEGYSVSRYPERTKLIKGKKITEKDINDFIEANKDILSKNPNAVVGTWYNKKDNTTYLDVSEVQKNKEKAIEVAKKYNQISIFDLKTFKEIETGGTGKVLSDKQLARKNFNEKIKGIRKSYEDKIAKIKQDAKNEKKAVNEVKKELLGYIKGSDVLNKVIKKTILNQAIKVNNPKKLDEFITTVEEVAAKESLSSARSESKKLIKSIKKKLKKNIYGNQNAAITELVNKNLSEIEDLGVLTNLNNLLVDLNRRNQPLINPTEIKELSSRIDEITLNVDAKQPKVKNAEQINSNIEKLNNKISESKLDVKSTDGAKEVISLARNLESLKKSLYKAEQEGKVTTEESEAIKKEILKIEKKLEGKTTEFNRERFDISKNILKEVDLKSFNKYEKEIIEELKEIDFIDKIGHIDNLFVASINISNGVSPTNVIGKILVDANTNKHSNNLSDLIKNRVDKHAGVKKWVGMLFDRIPTNLKKLEDRLAYTPLGLISEAFRAEKDVKNAGLIDKVIVAPLTRAMTRYQRDVEETLNNWSKSTDSPSGKFSNWVKGETSGKIMAIPFTKVLNPLYHKKQISDNKVGVILAQIQRNSLDGKNVLKTIIESKDLINTYSTTEQIYLKNIYKNLPKKTVDGKEVIDINKALSQLTSRERKMIDKFRDIMDNNLMPKQNHANQIRGLKFEEVTNYFPLILKPGAKGAVVSEQPAYQVWSSEIFNNNNKIAADAGKNRTSNKINAIEFNVNTVVTNRVKDVNRDFHFTQPVNKVRELIKESKLVAGDGYNNYFTAINNRMKNAVGLQLQSHTSFLNTEVLSPIMRGLYSSRLFRVGRIITEAVTETGRVFIGASERISDLPGAFRNAAENASSNINKLRNMSDNLIDKDLKGADINTSMQTILKLTDSQFLNRYSRHDIEFSKEIGAQGGLFNRVSNWALGAVDRNTLHLAFMPAFKGEFKKITGEEFNYSKIKDPAYQKKHKQAILDAAAIGDRAAMQWKNISVKGAGRTKIRTPWKGGVSSTSEFAPLLTFMGNFGYLEVSMAQKSIRDMVAGESRQTKLQGAQGFAAIMGAGIAYGMATTAEYLVNKYLIKKMVITNSYDDDKMGKYNEDRELLALKREFQEEWDKMFTTKGIKKQVFSNSIFLVNSKYSAASRALAMFTAGAYDEYLKTKGKADGMSSKEIQSELLESESFFRELLEVEDGISTSRALIKEGLYANPTTDVGTILEGMIPHIDNLMNQLSEANEAYQKFRAEGKIYDPETYSAEHEKFRDEIQAENLLMNALRLYFTFRGTAIPMDKMIQQYYDEMMNRYDKNVINFQDVKDDASYNKRRFPKRNRFGTKKESRRF